jgi:signal transduction histidine kinase
MEYRIRRYDDEYRWLRSTGVPRFTGDGAFVGFIGSAIDVTPLKEAEAALSNLSRRLLDAQERERSGIARELHDDVCQRLTAVTLYLEALRRRGGGDDDGWRSEIQQVCSELVRLGKDIHSMSRRLHSSTLDYLGIVTVASGFCRDLCHKQDVEIRFVHADVPRDLPQDVAVTLFRVLQEALHNGIKHAGVREFDVRLRAATGDIELEVIDGGIGFEPEKAMRGPGLGLISMRERVLLIHGDLSIASKPGAGTAIRVRAPIQPGSSIRSTDQSRTSGRAASAPG